MSAYPAAPRIFAGVGALAVALTFGMSMPASLVATGYPLTGRVMLATSIPLVALLAFLALAPRALDRPLRRWSRLDLTRGTHMSALILMAATLYFVLGYGSLTNGAFAYEHEVVRGEPAQPISGEAIFTGIALNLVVLVVPPVIYVSAVTEGSALRQLGIHADGAARALMIGFGSALAVLIVIAIASVAIEGLEVDVPENERALEIARSVTVLGAIGIAIGAAVSEEVFFRGFLQPRVGLLGQAVLFSLAHLTYLNVLQVVVTFVLALIFGAIYRWTGNLLAPMAGHFLFNLLMLLAGIYAPESA